MLHWKVSRWPLHCLVCARSCLTQPPSVCPCIHVCDTSMERNKFSLCGTTNQLMSYWYTLHKDQYTCILRHYCSTLLWVSWLSPCNRLLVQFLFPEDTIYRSPVQVYKYMWPQQTKDVELSSCKTMYTHHKQKIAFTIWEKDKDSILKACFSCWFPDFGHGEDDWIWVVSHFAPANRAARATKRKMDVYHLGRLAKLITVKITWVV